MKLAISLLLALALSSCSPSAPSPDDNNAIKFIHMIDPSIVCESIGHNPYAFDAAICKSGTSIIYARAGGGVVPQAQVIYDTKPAEKK